MAAAVFTLPGCSSDNNGDGPDNPNNPDTPSGAVLDVDATLPAEYPGDTYYINVASSAAWTAAVPADAKAWCSISPAAGVAGVTSVAVTIASNPGVTNREAAITFSAGDLTKTTTVTQYTVPNTFCEKCAWDQSSGTWVDAYVTSYTYPFETPEPQVVLNLFDYEELDPEGAVSGASSDKDGRANTDALAAANSQVALECRKLGSNWYLPAYEELINISDGSANAPLNGKPGLDLLQFIEGHIDIYHSSTVGAEEPADRAVVEWNRGIWNNISSDGWSVNQVKVFANTNGTDGGMLVSAGNSWQNTFHCYYREQ